MAQFDLLVIGSGPGGYIAAIRGAQLGLSTALVEKDPALGGTCLHRGCIPAKTWLETAHRFEQMQVADDYGIDGVDGRALKANLTTIVKRKGRIVTKNAKGIEFLMKKNKVTVLKGFGKLLGAGRVDVAGEVFEAKRIILATGSAPKPIPGLETDGVRVLNSDHILDLTELPSHLVILGAGAIGVEFASAWKELGAEISLVEVLPRIVPLEDPEVGDELAKLFTRRGIRVMAGTKVILDSVRTFPDHVELEVEKEGARERLSAERLLVATGRAPVSDGLGLEGLGVKIERGFIQVDGQMKTGVSHLYAIGDVVGGLMLAHKATHEGFIAVEAILGRNPHPLDPNRIPRCTYCRPQVASLGLSEAEAQQQGRKVKVGRFPMSANSMATILGERDGFGKIVSDEESMEILGVHLMGPRVTELIQGPALAKLLEATPEELALNVHPHPTVSEVLGEMADDVVFGQSLHFWRQR